MLFLISLLHADRPIASIAFHAQGEVLAVASGHKVRLTIPYLFTSVFGLLYDCLTLELFVSYIYGITTGGVRHPLRLLY